MSHEKILLSLSHVKLALPSANDPLEALSDVSFAVREGETFALVGESGCGKSLTASAIMPLLPEEAKLLAGEILFDGVSLPDLSEEAMRAWRGRKIAMIFQEPGTALNPVMTVGDQIAEALPSEVRSDRGMRESEVLSWLTRVGIPEPRLSMKKFPHELSGGQKQRVLIAMALAARPQLIIADEPTTALDVTLQRQVLQLLKDLQREYGLTILLITHDLAVVKETADRLSLLYAGETVETASVADFFARPLHPYAKALFGALPTPSRHIPLKPIEGSVPSLSDPPLGCRFAARCPKAVEPCFGEHPLLTRVDMLGNGERFLRCPVELENLKAGGKEILAEAQETSWGEVAAREKVLLELQHVNVSYGGRFWDRHRKAIVKDISLSLKEGETLALVGESGSGKTTTALATLGLLGRGARVTGKVILDGEALDFSRRESLARLRQSIQIIFQDPFASLDPRLTIRETLLEGMDALRPEWGKAEKEARLLSLLESVGLPAEALDRLPHAFSGGQRQRIAIARALAPEPRILICDEPTSALDVSVQAQILNLLRRLQREKSLSYLFITHNFAVVNYMADRMAVMKDGELVEVGETQRIRENPKSDYTRMLLESVPELELRTVKTEES